MKIDKLNDEFIVDCTNNSKEERQQVYKFLVDNRNYQKSYLEEDYPVIVCNKKQNNSNWDSLEKYYDWVGSKKDIPIYTFGEFEEMYLKEKFVLPVKWCVKDCKKVTEYRAKRFHHKMGDIWEDAYLCIDEFSGKYNYLREKYNYTEITFEQFKKYVLDQNNMKNNKQIIGYKLIKEEYREAAYKIANVSCFVNDMVDFQENSYIKEKLEEAGVLDLWFKKVYGEEFKVIPNTENKYEYNKEGIIRNINTNKEISQSLSTKGYYKVNLWINNKNISRVVHRLVAETFIPNPNNLETINHIDGNKSNNSVSNLEWCTIQVNNLHYKINNGKYNSKLTEEDILDIYNNYNNYGEQKLAAELYNVSEGTISFIKRDVSFSHITNNSLKKEEIAKAQKTIVKMYSSNKGEFEIEVLDGKAYYRPEDKELPKEWIRDIINSYGNILIQKNVINPYNVEISSINVGCYHNCKKEDWENVYKLLK